MLMQEQCSIGFRSPYVAKRVIILVHRQWVGQHTCSVHHCTQRAVFGPHPLQQCHDMCFIRCVTLFGDDCYSVGRQKVQHSTKIWGLDPA